MNHFLIDFENVSSDELKQVKGIKKNDDVVLFYSNACRKIDLESLNVVARNGISFTSQKIANGTKNALDFQLATQLGFLIATCPADDVFHIVSKDKGFDCLTSYWKAKNKNVDRVEIPQAPKKETPAPEPKKPKVDPADKVTLNELASVVSKNDMPDQILPIFNKYKTRVAINNGLIRIYKDTKRAGEVYQKLKPLLKKKNKK